MYESIQTMHFNKYSAQNNNFNQQKHTSKTNQYIQKPTNIYNLLPHTNTIQNIIISINRIIFQNKIITYKNV